MLLNQKSNVRGYHFVKFMLFYSDKLNDESERVFVQLKCIGKLFLPFTEYPKVVNDDFGTMTF
jgi:hypothetical protein